MREYRIGALWIGGALSFLEQLCLKSFLDAGQHVTLYTYDKVAGVPEGVEVAAAAAILPMDAPIRHSRTGSPAPQADRFRYHLLAQCDDVIWADTDAYCVRPFTTEDGHFHGWESEHHVNNGVLRLPPDSDTLRDLVEFTSDEFAIPEWLPEAEQAQLRRARYEGRPVGVGDQQWGAWGPRALTWYLKKTGEIRFSLPRAALYPISFKERRLLVKPGREADRRLTPQTFSIHLYGRRIRRRIQEAEGGAPPPDSLIGRLLVRHGIDPAAAPLPGPPPVPDPLPSEARRGRGVLNLTDLADAAGLDRGSRRHRYTELYQMLFHPMRERALDIVLLGLDGGAHVEAPDRWLPLARAMLEMWRAYFPNAQFTALDRAPAPPPDQGGLRYACVEFEDPAAIAAAVDGAPDVVIDDATHASHHQQAAFRALFPRLKPGGLYIVEDLRHQPAGLERRGSVRTAELFSGYCESGAFTHPDAALADALNGMRADISGCFLFPAQFVKGRRDQVLVVHKR